MNDDEELLRLVKENNTLLKMILLYVSLSSNSGFGDILTTGLGLVGNYLSNGNSKKQTAAV